MAPSGASSSSAGVGVGASGYCTFLEPAGEKHEAEVFVAQVEEGCATVLVPSIGASATGSESEWTKPGGLAGVSPSAVKMLAQSR